MSASRGYQNLPLINDDKAETFELAQVLLETYKFSCLPFRVAWAVNVTREDFQ